MVLTAREKVIGYLLLEGAEDAVFFSAIPWFIRRVYGTSDKDFIRTETLSIIRELLSQGLMEAVRYDGRDYIVSRSSVESIIDELQSGWADNPDPEPGELAIFLTTQKGQELAEAQRHLLE
jgi:hypothetical protein